MADLLVRKTLLTILALSRYLEDLQRQLAQLKGGEDEVFSPQSMEQELRPTEGKASMPDATGRAIQTDPLLGGDDLAEGESEWSQNLEGASQLTNPLSSGPSTFMAAASGRICKFCLHRLPSHVRRADPECGSLPRNLIQLVLREKDPEHDT